MEGIESGGRGLEEETMERERDGGKDCLGRGLEGKGTESEWKG